MNGETKIFLPVAAHSVALRMTIWSALSGQDISRVSFSVVQRSAMRHCGRFVLECYIFRCRKIRLGN